VVVFVVDEPEQFIVPESPVQRAVPLESDVECCGTW